jgi:hypothetical protein
MGKRSQQKRKRRNANAKLRFKLRGKGFGKIPRDQKEAATEAPVLKRKEFIDVLLELRKAPEPNRILGELLSVAKQPPE